MLAQIGVPCCHPGESTDTWLFACFSPGGREETRPEDPGIGQSRCFVCNNS